MTAYDNWYDPCFNTCHDNLVLDTNNIADELNKLTGIKNNGRFCFYSITEFRNGIIKIAYKGFIRAGSVFTYANPTEAGSVPDNGNVRIISVKYENVLLVPFTAKDSDTYGVNELWGHISNELPASASDKPIEFCGEICYERVTKKD